MIAHEPLLTLGSDKTFLSETYSIDALVGSGNSGDVYKVTNQTFSYALKVFFPYYAVRNRPTSSDIDIDRLIRRVKEMQEREHSTLVRIEHPNIVTVRGLGTITLSDDELSRIKSRFSLDLSPELPCILSNYVEGWNLKDAIEKSHLTRAEDIAYAIEKLADAIEYLHLRKNYVHADLRPENVLIRELDREPILIDFALCKNLDFSEVDASGMTNLEGDWDLFPTLIDTHPLRQIKERGGKREDLKKHALPALDFFQFGKLLQDLMPLIAPKFEVRERRYLLSVCKYLTDWAYVSQMKASDLTPRVSETRGRSLLTIWCTRVG